MSGIRILGIVLAVLGVAAAVCPHWFGALTGGPEPPPDVFAAVERRLRGGMALGVGLCCLSMTGLSPWSTSVPTAILLFMAGALAARLFGLVVDGVDSKQWLLVGVETGVMTVAALWLWYSTKPAP